MVSITSQGQLSIPAAMRRKLGIPLKGKVALSLEKGKIVITPVENWLDLKGSLHTNKKPLSNEQIHDLFAQGVIEDMLNEK